MNIVQTASADQSLCSGTPKTGDAQPLPNSTKCGLSGRTALIAALKTSSWSQGGACGLQNLAKMTLLPSCTEQLPWIDLADKLPSSERTGLERDRHQGSGDKSVPIAVCRLLRDT